MKVVVFGPRKRTGALLEGSVIDLSHAYAKYLRERTSEPSPLEMADVVVPSDLARLIEGGQRALEAADAALDYLSGRAQDKFGPNGELLVHQARPRDRRFRAQRGIVPIAGHANGPKPNLRPADRGAMSNILPVWDSGAPALAPQWNGGAGSAHWRQNRQYGTWGFYGGPVPTYWVWVPGSAVFDYPFADWRGSTGGWGNP